jgi:O-methyltransferase involved in polyketide biosynthesis
MRQARHPRSLPSLESVPSTLLAPLVARARGGKIYPWLDPHDTQAQQVLQNSHHAVDPMLQDRASVLKVLWHTHLIKQIGAAFFQHYPEAVGINLGAGFSDYFQWLDNGHNHWLDVDLEPVVSMRHVLLSPQSERAQNGHIDLNQPGWWQRLPHSIREANAPLLLVCEGVLMHLTPKQVKAVLQEIGDNAHEGSQLVCDFMTPLGIGKSSRLASSVSGSGAEFLWGAHNGLEVARQHPRLELLAQHTAAEAYGPACCWAEMCLGPWTGGPQYALAHLQITEP